MSVHRKEDNREPSPIVVVVVDEPTERADVKTSQNMGKRCASDRHSQFQKEVLVLLVLVLAREVRGQDWFGYGNKARKQGALTC